jgi:hypothetical protein
MLQIQELKSINMLNSDTDDMGNLQGADLEQVYGGNPAVVGAAIIASRIFGAATGAAGGAIGQAGINAATGRPLDKGVVDAAVFNGVIGAANPFGGAATLTGGLAGAIGGSVFGGSTVGDLAGPKEAF